MNKVKGALIILVDKIGYKVYLPVNLLMEYKIGQEVNLYIYHCVREDADDLYGFSSLDELNFFELLMTVSGVGPKTALGILSAAKINDLKQAIINGDASVLTVVSGVGNKTAQRIILELKNKISKEEVVGTELGLRPGDEEVIEGLISLGYSPKQARESVSRVSAKIIDVSQRLKEALRCLAEK